MVSGKCQGKSCRFKTCEQEKSGVLEQRCRLFVFWRQIAIHNSVEYRWVIVHTALAILGRIFGFARDDVLNQTGGVLTRNISGYVQAREISVTLWKCTNVFSGTKPILNKRL
jgi:hypothetical protein